MEDTGFILRPDEPLSDGLRRIVVDRLEQARATLQSAAQPARQPEAVHGARKRLKEIRAALRMMRPAFDNDLFQTENHCLRDVGRPLSAVRDAQVMVDALTDLKKHFKDELAGDAFASVQRALRQRRQKITRELLDQANLLQTTAAQLEAVQHRLADWPLAEVDWPVIAAGLKTIYRRGRNAMQALHDHPTDQSLHEWRKRSKDLRYQLTILQPLWCEVLRALTDQVHQLGNRLGDDHDLAVLAGLLEGELHDPTPRRDRQALHALITRRREMLQKHAHALGQRVYAEKPRAFIQRIAQYWQADQR